MALKSYQFEQTLSTTVTAAGIHYFAGPATAGALLFNGPAIPLTGNYQYLSGSSTDHRARVDTAYHGTEMAFQAADKSSTVFTYTTGATNQTLTNNNNESTGPTDRRLWHLGY
jgi:hypothetical protein